MRVFITHITSMSTLFYKIPNRLSYRIILLSIGYFLLSPAGANAAPPVISKAQLKAVYLYNFIHFANWPESQNPAEKDDIRHIIGVIGNSPVREALTELQDTLARSGKTPIITRFHDTFVPDMEINCCQILFISNSEEQDFDKIIAKTTNKPILTVTESDKFLDMGATILFRELNENIRYKINREAVEKSGIRLKAQLLKSSL